jgi:hypothetical protein
MTTNYTPIQEAALAAMVPVVALVAALDKKGILSMPDLYEELSLIELNAAASGTASARVLSEAAGTAKGLCRIAAFHVYIGPQAAEWMRVEISPPGNRNGNGSTQHREQVGASER